MSDEPINFQCDLSNVDTSRPCPRAGNYVLTCTKVEVKKNKDGTGHNLVVTLTMDGGCDCVPDGEGNVRQLKPGYELVRYYNLQAGDKEKDDPAKRNDWQGRVARLYDSFYGTTDKTRPAISIPRSFQECVGKKTVAVMEPKDDPEFGLKPEIKKMTPYNG